MQDWLGSAGFDREREDHWPRQWAEAYVRFAATEKRQYLYDLGLRVTPVVGWAERGDGRATGHGNSVPRFHLTWGTGPEVVRVFREPVIDGEKRGLVTFKFRHQVDDLIVEDGAAVGVRGTVLVPSLLDRGKASSREAVGPFELRAKAVIVTSGGIGGNHDLVRANWPTDRLGPAPKSMITGVPAHVDGRMLGIAENAGASLVNRDRMWHYVEGINNWDPIWPDHAIRIIPGPSSLWLDANGRRLPSPYFPGFDTLGTLREILRTGEDYSWFILTQSIIEKEFALSGSEQNPDITGKDLKLMLKSRAAKGAPGPVEAFKQHGVDFVVSDTLEGLVEAMNGIARGPKLAFEQVEHEVRRTRPRGRQQVLQGHATDGHHERPPVPRRQTRPGRQAAPAVGPRARSAHRGAPQHPDAQDPRWARDRPGLAGDPARRFAVPGPVRGRRGRRLRRWRRARIQRPGGHLPRWLHLLRPGGRAGRRQAAALSRHDMVSQ